MTDERPAPEDVEEHINQLETDAWSVEDYNTSYGAFEPFTVTVELEWTEPIPDDGKRAMKNLINGIEDEFDEGAKVDAVLDAATTEFGVSPEQAQLLIEQLKETGEVYQPNKDHLRTI